jgi:hypothetical protein
MNDLWLDGVMIEYMSPINLGVLKGAETALEQRVKC